MTDNDEIIEVVKLKIHDPVVQKEVAEWIIENMQQIEFPSSNTLERLIQAVEQIRSHNPENWKLDCFESFVKIVLSVPPAVLTRLRKMRLSIY